MSNQSTRAILASILAATGLAGCSEGHPALAPVTDTELAGPRTAISCTLDDAYGRAGAPNFTINVSAPVKFQGWVIDVAKQPPAKFSLILKGAKSYAVDGHPDIARTDVAKAMNAPNAVNSGFTIDTSAADVAPGTYSVLMTISQAGGSGKLQVCDANRQIIVAP